MDIAVCAAVLSMIDQMPGVCACKDEQSRFLYGNKEFKLLVGFDEGQDLAGLTDADIPCEARSDAEIFRQQDKYIIKQGIAITTLNVHRFHDEVRRAFVVVKEPFVDPESGQRGVIFAGSEISHVSAGTFAPHATSVLPNHASISRLSQGSFVIADSHSKIDMTPRENEVLYFLLRGGTAKRIGGLLSISSRTVEQYVDVLKEKFAVRTKADLIQKAISTGYLYFMPGSVYSKRQRHVTTNAALVRANVE